MESDLHRLFPLIHGPGGPAMVRANRFNPGAEPAGNGRRASACAKGPFQGGANPWTALCRALPSEPVLLLRKIFVTSNEQTRA